MTPAPGPHLSPDDVELWLNGSLDAATLDEMEALWQEAKEK